MTEEPTDMDQIPAYDPANPIFGPTDVGLTWGLEDTAGGPVVFMGFRTSNCTFTIPFDKLAEFEEFAKSVESMLKQFKNATMKAYFQVPPSGSVLFVPEHIAKGETMPVAPPLLPQRIKDNPQA